MKAYSGEKALIRDAGYMEDPCMGQDPEAKLSPRI